jgi:predicted RNA-binding Zn-ribbon protein involved in translation (DUF1610 family)
MVDEKRSRKCPLCGYEGTGWQYSDQEFIGGEEATDYYWCPKCGDLAPFEVRVITEEID